MIYFLDVSNTLKRKEIFVTKTGQEVIDITACGYIEKIIIIPDKTNIAVDEVINLILKWQKFDLVQGQYFDDNTNTQNFKLSIVGEITEVTPINGVATIQFYSETVGEFIIETKNLGVDNTKIKVVVQ